MPYSRTPGERIIELCKTYSISRETLAERSGLPLELIKNIEAGLIPDLAPLIRISRALGVRLGTLLDDQEELGPVITRAGEATAAPRFVTGLPEAFSGEDVQSTDQDRSHLGLRFNALASHKGSRHMEPFIVDIEPGAIQEKSSHEGEEFIYVLSGVLALEYGSASYTLNVGDSVYYDSIVPHRVISANENPTRILAVIYTPA